MIDYFINKKTLGLYILEQVRQKYTALSNKTRLIETRVNIPGCEDIKEFYESVMNAATFRPERLLTVPQAIFKDEVLKQVMTQYGNEAVEYIIEVLKYHKNENPEFNTTEFDYTYLLNLSKSLIDQHATASRLLTEDIRTFSPEEVQKTTDFINNMKGLYNLTKFLEQCSQVLELSYNPQIMAAIMNISEIYKLTLESGLFSKFYNISQTIERGDPNLENFRITASAFNPSYLERTPTVTTGVLNEARETILAKADQETSINALISCATKTARNSESRQLFKIKIRNLVRQKNPATIVELGNMALAWNNSAINLLSTLKTKIDTEANQEDITLSFKTALRNQDQEELQNLKARHAFRAEIYYQYGEYLIAKGHEEGNRELFKEAMKLIKRAAIMQNQDAAARIYLYLEKNHQLAKARTYRMIAGERLAVMRNTLGLETSSPTR